MSAPTKKPDAFGSLLAALAALYEDEIHRLAEVYRPRILAGEFSGNTGFDEHTKARGPEQGDPSFMRLEDELRKSHPWLATKRGRLAVETVSRWIPDDPGDCAAECMMHDILAAAAARGWVKPMRDGNDPEPYALRVA